MCNCKNIKKLMARLMVYLCSIDRDDHCAVILRHCKKEVKGWIIICHAKKFLHAIKMNASDKRL